MAKTIQSIPAHRWNGFVTRSTKFTNNIPTPKTDAGSGVSPEPDISCNYPLPYPSELIGSGETPEPAEKVKSATDCTYINGKPQYARILIKIKK